MKLKKENQVVKIEPTKTEFILSEHRQFPNSSIQTIKALARLRRRGFTECYIDFKMIPPLLIIGIIILAFIIF